MQNFMLCGIMIVDSDYPYVGKQTEYNDMFEHIENVKYIKY